MTKAASGATFVMSVDLDAGDSQSLPLVQAAVVDSLLALAATHGISATWAIADPASSPVVRRLSFAQAGHEAAVLATPDWVGKTVGRPQFARELTRQITAARAVGLTISSLSLQDELPPENLDLVIRQGITSIRGLKSASGQVADLRSAASGPRALHYGLREYLPTATYPAPTGWLAGQTWKWRVVRRIDRAIAEKCVVHVAVDTAAIASLRSEGWQGLASVLRHVARRRNQGRLTVATLAQLTARLSQHRQVTAARSILRAA